MDFSFPVFCAVKARINMEMMHQRAFLLTPSLSVVLGRSKDVQCFNRDHTRSTLNRRFRLTISVINRIKMLSCLFPSFRPKAVSSFWENLSRTALTEGGFPPKLSTIFSSCFLISIGGYKPQ